MIDPGPDPKRRAGRPRKAPTGILIDPVNVSRRVDPALLLDLPGETVVPPGPEPGLTNKQRLHVRTLIAEAARRQAEALHVYRPMPCQEAFHHSMARQRIIRGCLAAETPIYDPVAGCHREVGSIGGDFHVYAMNEGTGELVVARALKPFVKGVDDLYRVSLSNGESFLSTRGHRVWTSAGWRTVGEVSERLRRSGPCLLPSTGESCRPPSLDRQASVVSVEFVRSDYYYDLTIPEYHNYWCCSIVHHNSNRAGKSLSSLVELAWAVTGKHPVAGKYPEADGRAVVVAKDEDKIGEVIWRILGRAGSFRMTFDPELCAWRPYLPAEDEAKGLKPKAAPPLIPPRMIKDIAWTVKKKAIPDKVILRNGWEISFYSSKSDPISSIQGTNVDIVVFDEELVHSHWYSEAMARLVDRMGWFWWGATPQTGTAQLYDLHLRAEESVERGDPEPLVQEYFLSIHDNPYLTAKAKADLIASYDDEERRVRIDGEFAISGTMIYEGWFYPNGLHGVDPFPVPDGWTRFCAIDPGHQVCAVLFAACPPPKPDGSGLPDTLFGDYVYIYDEVYIRDCDAAKFAQRLKECVGEQQLAAYLIDHRGGHLTEIGSGKTPERQYLDALRKAKAAHFAKGGSFTYGSDDLDGGILRVKEHLRVREDGTARLRVLRGRAPNFVREMQRYRWKVVQGNVTEKPNDRNAHTCDCVRYLVMYPKLKYAKAKARPEPKGGALSSFNALKQRELKRDKARRGAGVTLG